MLVDDAGVVADHDDQAPLPEMTDGEGPRGPTKVFRLFGTNEVGRGTKSFPSSRWC